MGGEGGTFVAHVSIMKNLVCLRAHGECKGASGFATHG